MKIMRILKYSRGSRRVDLWRNVQLFNIIKKVVNEFLHTNYKSGRYVSYIQYAQFNTLCNHPLLIKEQFIISFIERLFVKHFFGSVRQQYMKLVTQIMS